jgi:hypothetical protein
MGDPGRSKMAGSGKPITERSAIWTEIRKVCIDEYEEKKKNANGTGGRGEEEKKRVEGKAKMEGRSDRNGLGERYLWQ